VKDPIWALADSQSNEALIIGDEIGLDKLEHFPDFQASLAIGKKVKAADKGFPGGDPFALIAWLAGHLSERGPLLSKRGLKRGDTIP
jgi:2-keto-4-pentenoate hydratase